MLALKKIWRWNNAFVLWLLDAWRFWPTRFLVVVLVVIIFGSQLPGTADDRVRYCGLSLQLLGILTVVVGLVTRRRLFNHPSLVNDLRNWLARRPRWGAKPQTIYGSIGAVLAPLSASVKGSVGVPPDASIEDRLAALEANIKSLKAEQAETGKELRKETGKLIEALDLERRMRESGVMEIRNLVNTLGAGGLHLEWAGVLWLVLGVILTTIPSEIAGWLKWFS